MDFFMFLHCFSCISLGISIQFIRAQAQVYWRQVFSGWDDWVQRLRTAMRGFEGGLEALLLSHVQRTSVTAGALIYGDLDVLGALPHISNARKTADQEPKSELSFSFLGILMDLLFIFRDIL